MTSNILSNDISPFSGIGLVTVSKTSKILDAWFPHIDSAEPAEKQKEIFITAAETPPALRKLLLVDEAREVKIVPVRFNTSPEDLLSPPKDAVDAYFRLHLLSMRKVKPNTINLDGIFTKLENVVWTNFGPCDPDNFENILYKLKSQGNLSINSIDKFPKMLDYVLPEQVRIADSARVRLGAYLSPGTTVMHEGFVNYNAGTMGAAMVEGRISAGVIVGENSDIGGGASIMGTLSGGGKERISIGKKSLLGANSGIGISIGNNCIVEAGLYLTAGTKLSLSDGTIIKAKELSGKDDLIFRRNSLTGLVEAIANRQQISLNETLHTN